MQIQIYLRMKTFFVNFFMLNSYKHFRKTFPELNKISSQFGIHRVQNYVRLDFMTSYIFFPYILLSDKSLILLPYLQCNAWSYVPLRHSITHIYILKKTTQIVTCIYIDIKSSLTSARECT